MGYEGEAEALGKGGHFGNGNHLASRPAQDHHVRVVDHDAFRAAAEIAQSFGEKNLAVKPLKGWIALKEQHARVAQYGRSGLHSAFLAGDLDFMRRRIVLEFLTGRKLVLPGGLSGWLGQAMPPTEGRKRLVGELRPAGCQLLMDPHKIPLAARQQLEDLLPIGFGLLGTLEHRHLRGAGTKNLAHT